MLNVVASELEKIVRFEMTYDERIESCKTCNNKNVVMGIGIQCRLTNELPIFDITCPDYTPNLELVKKKNEEQLKQKSAQLGKQKLIKILSILLIIGIVTIILSFLTFREFNTENLLTVSLRTFFSILLYYFVYIGKGWAKVLLVILLGLGILFAIILVTSLFGSYPYLVILLILPIIYGYVIYQLSSNADINNWIEKQSMENYL